MRNPIRAFFLTLLCAAFSFAALFAEPAAGASSGSSVFAGYPSGVSGDYAVYRDYTWKNPTWIGFLRYDDSTWGAFAVTPSSSSRVSVLFSTEVSGGALVLTGQNVISKITNDDVITVNYLMKLLPDLYGWRNDGGPAVAVASKSRSPLLPKLVERSLKLPQFGGAVTLVFAPEVPVFNLQGLRGSDGKVALELERMGRIQSGGDDDFFGFSPAGTPKAGAALAIPPSRKNETRKVDGMNLALDDQWTMVADNTFFLGDSAALIVDTLDLSLMQIPKSNLALSLVRMFSLSSATAWSVPSELAVSGKASRIAISNLFYDSERGTLNRDIKTCVPSADGKKCTIVSLSVSETAYRANKAYFDSIVK
jgi:hypothetical protein